MGARPAEIERLVESALAADFDGHEAFNCAGPDNALGRPLESLMQEQYGDVPDDCTVEGDASAFSIAKATRLLDWEPTHSWKTAADK